MLIKSIKATFVCTLLATSMLLVGCNKYVEKTDKKIETTLERVEDGLQQATIPDLPEAVDTVRTKDDIWLGNSSVKISQGDALPAELEEDDAITLSVSENATLPFLAHEITDATGIPVRLDSLQASNTLPEHTVPVNYSGKLSGLLDYVSNQYGVWWRYKHHAITFYTKETRVFNIYALPTETSLTNTLTGSSMGESDSGATASSSLNTTANLALWDNIETSLTQIVGDQGQLAFSRVAGTVTITGSPYIIREASDWINEFNQKLSRQVAISVKVLQVTLANSDNYGLDLQAAFKNSKVLGSLTSPYTAGTNTAGSLAMSIIDPNSKFSGTTAIIQALSTQGKTALLTSASATTLNNKVAPIQVTTQENYVKEVNVSTSGSGTDRSVDVDMETDTLNYGFVLEVLPRILDHGRLIVMFSLNLTDLVSLTNFSSAGYSTDSRRQSDKSDSDDDDDDDEGSGDDTTNVVQLPKMQTRAFIQEIAMRSGATLVLTGFEKTQDTTATAGIGKAKIGILGGQASSANNREVLVILMTPEVLESPLSPESRMRDF